MSSEGCDSRSVASSSHSDRLDGELDERLMRTLRDVKYRQGPKFPLFGDANFQRDCLAAHNALRRRHGCAPLAWSQNLADLAAQWAERLADKQRLLYPELHGIGENIFLTTANESTHLPSGEEVTSKWAKEGDNFDFNKPRWTTGCEHVTQMLWKETSEMGASRCWLPARNSVAVVVFYRPAGNANCPGDFAQNVPPPLPFDDDGDAAVPPVVPNNLPDGH